MSYCEQLFSIYLYTHTKKKWKESNVSNDPKVVNPCISLVTMDIQWHISCVCVCARGERGIDKRIYWEFIS